MDITLDFKNLAYLLSIFTGFQVAIVLIYFGIRKNSANFLLGCSYLFMSYGVLLAALISSGAMIYFPSLYRTGNLAGLLFAPLLYLYVRQVVQGRFVEWIDLIHLLPFLIFLVDFWPVYNLPVDEKYTLILSEIGNPAEFTAYNQSRFFPSNFHGLFRTVLVSLYWIICVRLIYKSRNEVESQGNNFGKTWVSWMKIYLTLLLFCFLPYFMVARFVDPMIAFDLVHFSVASLVAATGITLFYYPKLLYGLDEFEYLKNEQEEIEEDFEKNVLGDEKIKEIAEQLDQIVFKKKSFLVKGYTLSDLARDTKTPSYLLTIYINSHLNSSFTELINRERINESVTMIREGFLEKQTIEGIADACGFNNRNTFITAFKRYQGMTPSVFKNTQKSTFSN